jgi:hypothetical protein
MATPNAADARPRLVRDGAPAQPTPDTAERRVPSLVWVLLGLLAVTLGAAVVQTERLDRMSDRAVRLAADLDATQIELAGARTQIRSFEMQRQLVQESVTDLAQRVSLLDELVRTDPAPPPIAPPPAPAAEPAR